MVGIFIRIELQENGRDYMLHIMLKKLRKMFGSRFSNRVELELHVV